MGSRLAYFRPTADVSVGHSLSTGSTAYNLLAEETADDASTYIYQSINSSTSTSASTTVRLTGEIPVMPRETIANVVIYVRAMYNSSATSGGEGSAEIEYTIDGTSSSGSASLTTSWKTFNISVPTSMIEPSRAYDIPVTIKTTGAMGTGTKASSFQIRVTQIYMEVTYIPHYEITNVACGTGTISASKEVEIDDNATIALNPGTDKRVVKLFDNDIDVTSQIETVDPQPVVTVTPTISGATYGFPLDSSDGYYKSNVTSRNQYAVAQVDLELVAEATVTFSIINYNGSRYTSNYGMIGNTDYELPVSSSNTNTQWIGNTAATGNTQNVQTYQCIVPAGTHFIRVKYIRTGNQTGGNTAMYFKVSAQYNEQLAGQVYNLYSISDDHTIKVIYNDYVEIYTKVNGQWKKTEKLYIKANGAWVEQVPQIDSIWATKFDTSANYENIII